MKTFSTVEDYLEVISGKRDITGAISSNAANFFGFHEFKPIVSLARYDVNFLDSVTDSTLGGSALTDRQAELAVRIIQKYQRQLVQKGIDTSPLLSPQYRNSLRYIDRTRRCYIDREQLVVRFPYDSAMIQQLRDLLQSRQGAAKFDKSRKEWIIAPSEYNINFVVAWAQAHSFDIDPELHKLMDEILLMEKQEYLIQLRHTDSDDLEITHAEQSLLDHIHRLGMRLTWDHVLGLVDLAPVLGYTVHEDVIRRLESSIGSDVLVFALNRFYELSGDHAQLHRVLRYARLVNRLPVVVFDSSANSSIDAYRQLLEPEDESRLLVLGNHAIDDWSSVQADIVFANRVPKVPGPIPLLLSHNGILVGGEKQMMLQNSEKIIYFEKKLTP